jgi:uncharacterized protein YrrD
VIAAFDLVGLPVRSENGRQLGAVQDLLFDTHGRQLLVVVLQQGFLRPRREFVRFDQLRALGRDELVAAEDVNDVEMSASPVTSATLRGKSVVSSAGRLLGSVWDIWLDEETGQVRAFELTQASERTSGRAVLILGDQPSVIGDVIIVPDSAWQTLCDI